MDRDVYIPVRCDEVDTQYSGGWYWERVRSVIEINGAKVDRERTLTGSDFKPGDKVVVKFKCRTYSGSVIDPEIETLCLTGDGSLQATVMPLATSSQATLTPLPLATSSQATVTPLPLATSSQATVTPLPLATSSQATVTPLATTQATVPMATSSQVTVAPYLASTRAESPSLGKVGKRYSETSVPPAKRRKKPGKVLP